MGNIGCGHGWVSGVEKRVCCVGGLDLEKVTCAVGVEKGKIYSSKVTCLKMTMRPAWRLRQRYPLCEVL